MSTSLGINNADDIVAWPAIGAADAAAALEAAGHAVIATMLGPGSEPVAAVTRFVTDVATKLFPAWLPDAAGIDDRGEGICAVRSVAGRLGTAGDLFAPFVEDLAEAAVTRSLDAVLAGYAPQTVLRQCHRLLRRSYAPRDVTLVIDLHGPGLDEADEVGLAWLASLDAFPVRLVGEAAASLQRIRSERATAPTAGPVGSDYATPLRGRPNPISATEQRLERYLSHQDWAFGRSWNETLTPGALELPLRVDLVWHDARCIVEIDGQEHAGGTRYAADRRRDRALMRMGFAVLRFTNDEVNRDVAAVAAEIAAALAGLRAQAGRAG